MYIKKPGFEMRWLTWRVPEQMLLATSWDDR